MRVRVSWVTWVTYLCLEALQQNAFAVGFARQQVQLGVPEKQALPRLALRVA